MLALSMYSTKELQRLGDEIPRLLPGFFLDCTLFPDSAQFWTPRCR